MTDRSCKNVMKPKLILISHGFLVDELYGSAKMIVGEIEGLYTLPMLLEDGLDKTREKLNHILLEIGASSPTIIIADILGGTPCNAATEAIYQNNYIRVLTGLNLSMVIEYAFSPITDLDEMAIVLKAVGISAVTIIEKSELSSDGNGYED